jgi:hypothetical protein
MSKEALAHGLTTFTVATLFNEMGASHLFTYILIMEVSTTILTTTSTHDEQLAQFKVYF